MATLPSGLPDFVADEEPLARFLTQGNQHSGERVKQSVFLPNRVTNNTSVFRIGDDRPLLRTTWEETSTGRPLKGAAIVTAGHVRESALDVIAREPPPRHADIESWPQLDDPGLQKGLHKELAAKVAAGAKFIPL